MLSSNKTHKTRIIKNKQKENGNKIFNIRKTKNQKKMDLRRGSNPYKNS